MSLEEIKDKKDRRNPDFVKEVLALQVRLVDDNIEEWVRARKLLLTLLKTLSEVSDVDENAMTIQFLPEQAIVFGDVNDYSGGKTDYDALLSFYNAMSEKYPKLDLNYSVWATFTKERILRGDWVWPDRFYFFNREGHDKRPAALYAVGYTRGGYGQSDELYKRLIKYIYDNGFEISGDAYEEYPLNEVCIAEEDNYLIRVMITVRESDTPPESEQ